MQVKKELGVQASALTEEDMRQINRFTRKALQPEDVYTFRVLLCDNEIDRDYDRFSVEALQELSKLFLGKTGIFDHNPVASAQTARIYSTEVLTDEERITSAGEPYTALYAKAYMPKTEKNATLMQEIESGIKKEVSVSCAVAHSVCSICGKPAGTCMHQKSKRYQNAVCCYILQEPTDAYEWSFVAVPAQRAAGVVKQFTADNAPDAELQKLAGWGRAYREQICEEIVQCGKLLCPAMPKEILRKSIETLSMEELTAMRKSYREQAARTVPFTPQLARRKEAVQEENTEFQF